MSTQPRGGEEMNGEWGRGRGVEIGCIQWDVDRVVCGENGDEMNGDVQWFVCLDRDGESEMEEGEGVGTKRMGIGRFRRLDTLL